MANEETDSGKDMKMDPVKGMGLREASQGTGNQGPRSASNPGPSLCPSLLTVSLSPGR